jgi:hypothetical protein
MLDRWKSRYPEKYNAIRKRAATKYRKANPEKVMALQRKRALHRKFRMTVEDYDRMLVAQNGVCAICRKPEKIRPRGRPNRLAVDHREEPFMVRGLLCNVCNRGIGMFQDDPALLRAAAGYLERNS